LEYYESLQFRYNQFSSGGIREQQHRLFGVQDVRWEWEGYKMSDNLHSSIGKGKFSSPRNRIFQKE
jgi:hypothetical protein